ncbi:alanine racemase [Salipiger sp. 1_MG-2023]|uniref:alanine racemase n=1 Tax=Salipiger sp. 1_MG-2023 TaxID=3062665 RepID=UPI0026E420D2|nr:alanine racemase [Salipiger sp. 1_MG-2023]MDO6584792.1 alanine racemase [Salipiger sp. 1_MG-2023]
MQDLHTRDTPFLALDKARLMSNCARMRARADALGVTLRPHLKTVKSVPAAKAILGEMSAPATVSTLQEAEAFAQAGATDLIYAVGIAPAKLPRVAALRATGVDIAVILDSVAQAEAVVSCPTPIPALIEIDTDGARAGLAPDAPEIVQIGRILDAGAALRGVLTHGGASYGCFDPASMQALATQERDGALAAAKALTDAGLPCPVISVGSTPTAWYGTDLTGITELRAGVYTLSDLMMAGLGVGTVDDIAASVVTTVIGHQPSRGWIVTDAGFMALSKDHGTAAMPVDQGYGLVAALDGTPFGDLVVRAVSQEHGILALRPGSSGTLPELPIGSRLRIYPNHACATVAMHPAFAVCDGMQITEDWPILRGW